MRTCIGKASSTSLRTFSSTQAPRNFARVQILGRLGGNPEPGETNNGTPTVSYKVAVNPPRPSSAPEGAPDPPANWYNVTSYGEVSRNYLLALPKGYELLSMQMLNPARELKRIFCYP